MRSLMRAQVARSQLRRQAVGLLARGVDGLIRSRDSQAPIGPEGVRRLLVVLPCCIGDLLMATPALRALRKHFTGAEIFVATTEWSAPALQDNPNVSGLIRYPSDGSVIRVAGLGRRLRDREFDIGIGLDRSPTVNTMLVLAGIPERVGIDSQGRGVGLTRSVIPVPRQHETDLFLSVIASLGVPPAGRQPEFFIHESFRTAMSDRVPRADGPIVVIHPGGAVNPGASMFSKRWPAVRFGELASLLAVECGASIVVVGAESDRDAVQTAIDFTDAPVTDLSGNLTVDEVAALVRHASVYVGNDSGMSHLAAAVGTPTVTIFGPTNPARYRPLGPNAIVCAPVDDWSSYPEIVDLRVPEEISPEFDIREVEVAQVLTACREALANATAIPEQ